MDIGSQTMAGFAIGIEQSARLPERAMTNAVSSVVNRTTTNIFNQNIYSPVSSASSEFELMQARASAFS